MYESHRLAMSNGVAQFKKDVPFRVLVANFSNVNKRICRHLVIGNVLPHPKAMVATCLQLDSLLAAEFSVPLPDQQEVLSDTAEVDTTSSKLPSVEDVNLEHLPSDVREKSATCSGNSSRCGRVNSVKSRQRSIESLSSQVPNRFGRNRTGQVQPPAWRFKRQSMKWKPRGSSRSPNQSGHCQSSW